MTIDSHHHFWKMPTEADWQNWKKEDFFPYLDIVKNVFGTDRLMFGSDWPVCLVAADYEKILFGP